VPSLTDPALQRSFLSCHVAVRTLPFSIVGLESSLHFNDPPSVIEQSKIIFNIYIHVKLLKLCLFVPPRLKASIPEK
jgi:hypothetical protein